MSGFRTGCGSVISWVHMTHRCLSSRLMSVPCQMMSRISSRCCWRSLRALKGCRFLERTEMRFIWVHYEGVSYTELQITLVSSFFAIFIPLSLILLKQTPTAVFPCQPRPRSVNTPKQTVIYAQLWRCSVLRRAQQRINTLPERTPYWFFTVWRRPGLPSRHVRE